MSEIIPGKFFGRLLFSLLLLSVFLYFLLSQYALLDGSRSLLISFLFFLATGFMAWLGYSASEKFLSRKLTEIHGILAGIRSNEKPARTPMVGFEDLRDEIRSWSEERKKEIEQMKKLESYRKEFLGNVSHELKTPVFNIQGYISTLLEGGLDDAAINKKYLDRADKNVERMISIVDDLESISQLETGEMRIEPERIDLVALFREVFDMHEMQATSKGILFSMEGVQSDQSCWAYADKFRIRQVLTNLIVNSIRYGKEYGQTKVRLRVADEVVQVDVEDNGIGIPLEHQPRIFERFYRVDKGRSREEGGTGLGLSIVKHIIEAHGQTIWVTSALNEGTVFSFTLKSA